MGPDPSNKLKFSSPPDRLAERILRGLKKEYVIMYGPRIRGWQLYLAIGMLAGLLSDVVLVASKNGRLVNSEAADQSVAEEAVDAKKSPLEKLVNPFGHPWNKKRSSNPDIPIAFAACFTGVTGDLGFVSKRYTDDRLVLSPEEMSFIQKINSPFYYDQCVAKLVEDMTAARTINTAMKSINPGLKSVAYYIINFLEQPDMYGAKDFEEEWYVHKKGTPPVPENRIPLRGEEEDGQYLMDITNQAYRVFVAHAIAEAMEKGDFDMVLLDWSGYWTAAAMVKDVGILPDGYHDNYFAGIVATLREVTLAANAKGKMVLYNPFTPDGPYYQDLAVTRQLLEATNGSMWEQPFRREWRDVGGPDLYYAKIKEFFALAQSMGKYLVIVQNTMLEQSPYKDLKPCPDWRCAFSRTNKKKEQSYARYYLSFYLNFFTDHEKNHFLYFTPISLWDIFLSETLFPDWDLKIGAPQGVTEKVVDHVYRRKFANGEAWVNNSDAAYRVILGRSLFTTDKEKVEQYTMPPHTGMLFVTRAAF